MKPQRRAAASEAPKKKKARKKLPPRVLKSIALARGRKNEQRVLDACRRTDRPEWIRSARFASRAEDRNGVDVVLETDVGRLYLQVKSSRLYKEAFEAEKRRVSLPIPVVVIRPQDDDARVLNKVVGALAPIRARFLKERARFVLR